MKTPKNGRNEAFRGVAQRNKHLNKKKKI